MTDASNALRAAKQRAAIEAVDRVESGMVVGLGSGSTAAFALEELARRLGTGELRDIVGIPTSSATHQQAVLNGVPVGTLEQYPVVHVTIDGADEVSPDGDLIKGLGVALLREKIVAVASRRLVIVVDETKLVDRLGTRAPLPVEVVHFGAGAQLAAFRQLGAEPTIRQGPDGRPYRTDEGHLIVECRFADGIANPAAMARALRARPGVVETGLFLGMHPDVVVGRVSAGGRP
jgi:ribose 5-phosphate isomerase A